MRGHLARLALKTGAGFVIALAVWLGLSAPYTRVLASLSEGVLRAFEQPAVTSIASDGTTLMAVSRSDQLPSEQPTLRLAIESTDLTFNFILLVTLFAASARMPFERNLAGFAAAVVALLFVHVLAVVAFVEADYATRYGAWSASHYGPLSRSFWQGAPYFYSIVGVHASAFALWWLFRPGAVPVPVAGVLKNRRQRRAAARRAGRRASRAQGA